MNLRALVLAGALATAAATGCGGPSQVASTPATGAGAHATVTYCTDGGKPLSLDVYEPQSGSVPRPLLIFVHGGSWAFGSSSIAEQSQLTQRVVAGALSRGFAVASVNYRLAPADPWPAQIIDVRCAIRYLRASASRWGVDPRRFAAMGNSAGAQLVSLAALSAGQVPAWDGAQFAAQPSSVAAVVDFWGPMDLLAGGWSKAALEIGQVVFRLSWGTQDATLAAASPTRYVRPGAPPFLIVQGSADTLVPPAQSVELRDRLVAAGDSATLILVSHAAHELIPSGAAISPGIDTLATETLSFLVTTLL
ncbi:MAG TPA: alpha/beta hydrolase [Candidatus Dormibacteraeota bacterium]|nr:alpha/beta hydrolase [Candidatus Dormibacteraeota bacterium]